MTASSGLAESGSKPPSLPASSTHSFTNPPGSGSGVYSGTIARKLANGATATTARMRGSLAAHSIAVAAPYEYP